MKLKAIFTFEKIKTIGQKIFGEVCKSHLHYEYKNIVKELGLFHSSIILFIINTDFFSICIFLDNVEFKYQTVLLKFAISEKNEGEEEQIPAF